MKIEYAVHYKPQTKRSSRRNAFVVDEKDAHALIIDELNFLRKRNFNNLSSIDITVNGYKQSFYNQKDLQEFIALHSWEAFESKQLNENFGKRPNPMTFRYEKSLPLSSSTFEEKTEKDSHPVSLPPASHVLPTDTCLKQQPVDTPIASQDNPPPPDVEPPAIPRKKKPWFACCS